MTKNYFDLSALKQNWKSGLTVSLVSLPLSIPLSVASGVDPIAGIITAFWAGLVASFFGGSNYNIIGPTGALSGIIASYVITYGASTVSMLAIFTGFFVLLAYLLKLEKYLIFIPSSVIHGFTLGVALIITLNHLKYAFGLTNLPKHDKLIENFWEVIININNLSLIVFIIFIIFFFALQLLRKLLPTIPGTIILTPIGIFLGYLSTNNLLSFKLQTLGQIFGEIKPTLIKIPDFVFTKYLISSSIVVAFIAILETMLSAKIADAMTKTKSNTRYEMFGLGLANIASGLAGGIPATAALARTALNIRSGATNKISATVSSVCIAIFSFLFLSYFRFLPMCVVAAILTSVAFNMIERENFKRLYLHDKTNFFVSIVVALVTIYEDPIIGILSGTIIALLVLVNKMSISYYSIIKHERSVARDNLTRDNLTKSSNISSLQDAQNHILIYSIKGKLVYINTQGHLLNFENNFQEYNFVILNLSDIYYIDLDGVDAIEEIIDLTEQRAKKIVIVCPSDYIESMLNFSKKFKKLKNNNLVFEDVNGAIKFLENI